MNEAETLPLHQTLKIYALTCLFVCSCVCGTMQSMYKISLYLN